MQLKINRWDDIVFKWIPYDQFTDIKEIFECGIFTIHSAIWKESCDYDYYKYKRVALECLYNSRNSTNEFLNEVCKYLL